MVNKFTNIFKKKQKKTNNHLSPQLNEHKKDNVYGFGQTQK